MQQLPLSIAFREGVVAAWLHDACRGCLGLRAAKPVMESMDGKFPLRLFNCFLHE